VCVCYHDNWKIRASILTKLGLYVEVYSDHLQLIKFWPSHSPGKGFCGGAKIFGSTLLQPEHGVCVSSKRFLLTIEQTTGKSYPVLWGMIQPLPNLPGMMWYINRSPETKWSGLPTKSNGFFRGHIDCERGYASSLPNYSVCTMSLCLAVVTVIKHQHDIMFELFINTTIIKTGQLLINYCKINMVTNIK